MIETWTLEPDGRSVVLDFTKPTPVSLLLPVLDRIAIPRATASSRTPGRVNRGSVSIDRPHLIRCEHCGSMRRSNIPGVHAPTGGGRGLDARSSFDCIGRRCELGADGYYHPQLATPEGA